MPTPAQVANRNQPPPPERHRTATVTATGPPCTVRLDPGNAETTAGPLDGVVYPPGARVLVLLTWAGNWILGRIGAAP